MSLKPITNDDALENKSLNLYANSITANEINGAGTVELKDIECETLTVSGNAQFSGPTTLIDGLSTNIASDSITVNSPLTLVTGNDLRISSDLTGSTLKDLQVDLNPVFGSGTANETIYNSRVTVVGKNVFISGYFTFDATSKTIIIDLDFPTGTNSNNIGGKISGSGQINAGRIGGGAWSMIACQENAGKIRMQLYSVNDAAVNPVNNTFVALYYNISFENIF